MTTRNGLNAAYESPVTEDSIPEQTEAHPAAEIGGTESTVETACESAQMAAPPEGNPDMPEDSLREQLNALVQALSEKTESEPVDEQVVLDDDFALPNVVNRPDEPAPEEEQWQPTFHPVSMEAMRNVLSKPLYGFMAGLVASVAVGGGMLLFTPLMSEPPAMASNEASPEEKPVFAAAALPVPVEVPTMKMQGRLSQDGAPVIRADADSNSPARTEEQEVEVAVLVEAGTDAGSVATDETTGPREAVEVASAPVPEAAVDEPEATSAQGTPDSASQPAPDDTIVNFDTVVEPSTESGEQEIALAEAIPESDGFDSAPPLRIAHALTHVNMRASPDNAAPVVAIVSEGSPVEIVHCNHWCEVTFAGQRGWIYGDLISASGTN